MTAGLQIGRRTGGHDNGLTVMDVAETVRDAAVEQVGFTLCQDAGLIADGDFQRALQNEAALIGEMFQPRFSGVGALFIDFMQHLQVVFVRIADLAKGHAPAGLRCAGG